MATDLSEDVQFFIRFLRDQRLDWIADQLAQVIQEGKSDTKKIKKLKREGVTTRPFTEREQEDILLTLLEAYFVTLPNLIPTAVDYLNDAFPQKANATDQPQRIAITIRELESDQDFVAYTADLKGDTGKLRELLAAARKTAVRGG